MSCLPQLFPLIIVASISGLAVLHHRFNDNLMQRIGLSGICIGACLRIAMINLGTSECDQSITVLLYGLAAFGVGTFIKVHRFLGGKK